MDAAAEIGRDLLSKHQRFSLGKGNEQADASLVIKKGRDGTAEPVSRNQILRRERGPGNVHFSLFI